MSENAEENEDEVKKMLIDNHVFERMTVRLTDPEEKRVIHAIEMKWNRLQDNQKKDFAIVAMDLYSMRMTDDSGWNSNGRAVVGIVRHGVLKTVMLRRFNQPMTKEALRVDSVKWAIKPPQVARHQMRKNKNRRNRRY